MKLDEQFVIESEPNNWILKELAIGKIDKEGNQVYKETYYYPELKYALKKYLNETLKPCAEAQDILNRIEEVEALIETIKTKE